MISLIGVRHDTKVEIREKLSVIPKRQEDYLGRLLGEFSEGMILSTCNRSEIYVNSEYDIKDTVDIIFKLFNWDRRYRENIFTKSGEDAALHIFEVSSGFDSIIVGEDQILGQLKDAYEKAMDSGALGGELQRLIQYAVSCGKEFRTKSGLYKYPVSSSSIVAREAAKRGTRRFMILGYGDVGSLTSKYILEQNPEILYIAVRDISCVEIKDERVKAVPFSTRNQYYGDVQCIISCTSAPHPVIYGAELPDKEYLLFDLAVPRDVDESVYALENTEVYDIDRVGFLYDENQEKRKNCMIKNRYIVDKYMEQYDTWRRMKPVIPYIEKIKEKGKLVSWERQKSFRNKCDSKDKKELADILIKSTSDFYINRAIEVLKEEQLKGRGEECLKILEKVFLPEN